METLTVRHSDFDGTVPEDDSVTRLPTKEFDALLQHLEEGEKDPCVLQVREQLMNTKPVWED